MNNAQNNLRVSLSYLKCLLNRNEGVHFIHVDRDHVFLQGEIECDALDYRKELERSTFYQIRRSGYILAQQVLQISPRKLLTHTYDDWFLEIRNSVETQYCTLCSWASSYLRYLGRLEEADMYECNTMILC
jgi:DNA-binding SARP family transcriptional activator